MHDAYEATLMLKLGVQIESMTAYDDYLLIGTREGHLLMYNVAFGGNDSKGNENKNPSLYRYSKNFSKKRIVQIAVVPEYNLLLLLTDNIVCIHDLNSTNLNQIGQLQKTRGATLFALDIQRHENIAGEVNTVVTLCVAVKRKLQLYYWKEKKKTFEEFFGVEVAVTDMPRELSVPDIPRELAWCGETLVLGFRGFSYTLMDFQGKAKELFPTGKSPEPSITKLSDNSFVLGKDSQSVIMDTNGELIQHNPVKWSDLPSALAWDDPYLLGIVHDTLEVYTLESCMHIQTIPDLNKARLICRCKQGKVYVASMSQVWCISATDFAQQIRILLEQSQFQLALKLTNLSDLSEEEKAKKTYKIQTLYAHHLFRNKNFREAMQQFLKLGTDPYEVIRLFPDLVSQPSNANEPNEPEPNLPKLQDRDLESGLLALIDYLTEVRYKLINDSQAKEKDANGKIKGKVTAQGDKLKNITPVATEQLLKIIDTTLLKCYLQTNDALVAPLLRLNHCHLAEAEKTLLQHQKYPELIILYQTKGQHKKALELLEKQSKENDSSLKGTERTIQYLQHLGKDHMELILKFAGWVLEQDPGEGLRIFMEDVQEVEHLPRPKVLDYLLRCHKDLVITYLEHVVHVWEDNNPLFHNVLVHQYKEKCLAALTPSVTPAEKENVQHIRQKLQQFLEKSQHYTPETVLRDFPFDCLYEERAIILGRLGRHQQAVSIYINLLNDVPKAIQYCNNVYARYQNQSQADKNKQQDGNEEVYVTLIRQLLRPDDREGCASELMLMDPSSTTQRTAQPDLETALELLEEHAAKIEPQKALDVLPDSVPIGRIRHFLEASLQNNINEKRRMQVLKGLLYAEHLQVQEQRMHYESQSVLMTEFNICPVCKKRFGNQSAFARYPNGDIVHFSCQIRKM
ncbi:vam6/Vps39-like protein [Nasonia vitripennis]|uniref:CNH domain-containing protein n=1 Tax=Nasonia vitripennis TaxID=7425 RepID=A0A7M7QFT9_NASVI|nr:vam6/Vps39-like protein [Nasonia vitripennis]